MPYRTNTSCLFLIVPVLLFLHATTGFCQEKSVESLTAELKKFEAEKARLGSDFPVMKDTLKADILSSLAITVSKSNPEKTFLYAKEQLAISTKIDYKYGMANANEILANAYDYRGDYDYALKLFLQARSLYNQIGRRLDALNVDNSIGVLYAKKGIYTEGLKYLFGALKTAKKENDYWGLVGTYNNIGIIYTKYHNHDDALKYYLESLALQLKDDRKDALSYTYMNIGEIYKIKNQTDKAISYFNLGINSAEKTGDKISLANNYSNLGLLYSEIKQYNKARLNQLTALRIRQDINDRYGLFTSYLSLGSIYYETGETLKALEYCHQAEVLVKETGELDMSTELYRQLAKIYASQGNYKMAYESHMLYKQFNDSVFNAENQRKLTEQKMNFEFKDIQEKKDTAARAALQKQKNIRNLMVAGLTCIALCVIVWLVLRHKKTSAKKQLAYNEGINELQEELTTKDLEAQALMVEKENIELKNNIIAIEKEYEKGEKEKLQEKLDFNRRELASATLYLYQKNELLSGLKEDIDALVQGQISSGQISKIKGIIQQNLYMDADWDKFKIHFEQVHPDFFKDLNEKHPTLTAYEVRLCAYLHIKLSTKEIAGLLNITPASVNKAKVRLNKKLNKAENDDVDDVALKTL
ncbi:MAG: tetratricopeptide repeat protein [Bacteroidota bacterium]